MKKKLSLVSILKEETGTGHRRPEYGQQISWLMNKNGLSREELLFLLKIDRKLTERGSDLFSFVQQLTKLQEDFDDSAMPEPPVPQPEQNDPFAEFEGQEENPADAAEAQQWQQTLNKRQQITPVAAQMGYFQGIPQSPPPVRPGGKTRPVQKPK